ncbi:MAG: leucine-rich repeat domain-containing protein [Phycisphaerales bacterium]
MRNVAFVLILSTFWMPEVQAEEPVFFEDPNLKAAIEEELWVLDPTPSDMLGLTFLWAQGKGIKSLVGLQYATNLLTLGVADNQHISDISPLAGLTQLSALTFNQNRVQDISPLAGLVNLTALDIHHNQISDISVLSGTTKLERLSLHENPVGDISPLASLVNLGTLTLKDTTVSDISALTSLMALTYLDLRGNSLSDEAYEVDIPQIMANNPGITILHDRYSHTLTISSTRGGSVVRPGEGTFVYYTDGQSVLIEAKADPGFVFGKFFGTLTTQQNPFLLDISQSYQIQAIFESLLDTTYADDDASGDPVPGDASVSDPQENGTPEHPYDSIQEAIEVAGNGTTVRVLPGTYCENIMILGKAIDLIGREPNDPNGTALPVIRADQNGSVVSVAGASDSHCTLTGFAITGGKGPAGTVACSDTSVLFSHCLIAGNRPTGFENALIKCTNSGATFVNCTIADNYIGICNGGIRAVNSVVTLKNSIFYHNTYNCWSTAGNNFSMDDASEISITYSDIEAGRQGLGNIDADPLFARRGQWTDPQNPLQPRSPTDSSAVWLMGDYHLLSDTGRWDASAMAWLCDEAASPCIDAGEPAGTVGCEPTPNGGIVNMGVYGGTTEASKNY